MSNACSPCASAASRCSTSNQHRREMEQVKADLAGDAQEPEKPDPLRHRHLEGLLEKYGPLYPRLTKSSRYDEVDAKEAAFKAFKVAYGPRERLRRPQSVRRRVQRRVHEDSTNSSSCSRTATTRSRNSRKKCSSGRNCFTAGCPSATAYSRAPTLTAKGQLPQTIQVRRNHPRQGVSLHSGQVAHPVLRARYAEEFSTSATSPPRIRKSASKPAPRRKSKSKSPKTRGARSRTRTFQSVTADRPAAGTRKRSTTKIELPDSPFRPVAADVRLITPIPKSEIDESLLTSACHEIRRFFNGPLTACTTSHVGAPQVQRSAKTAPPQVARHPACRKGGWDAGVQGDRRVNTVLLSPLDCEDWHLLRSIERDLSGANAYAARRTNYHLQGQTKMILQTNLTGNGSRFARRAAWLAVLVMALLGRPR